MRKNFNHRKISLVKNTIWHKELRRQSKIKNKISQDEFANQDEISLLFPSLSDGKPEAMPQIEINLKDEQKNIYEIFIPDVLYQSDILDKLVEHKNVNVKGFRTGKTNITFLDMRYGKQIRNILISTKYEQEARNLCISKDASLQEKLSAAFNVQTGYNCSFNIIFYNQESDYRSSVEDFLKTQQQKEELKTEEDKSQKENITETKDHNISNSKENE